MLQWDETEQPGQIEIGFMLPDFAVIERLGAGYAALRQNPSLLRRPLRRYGRKFVEDQAIPFFERRAITVAEGWPMEEGQIPGVFVTLTSSSEDASRQIIGGQYGEFTQGIVPSFDQTGDGLSGERVIVDGTFFNDAIQIAHYGLSQREANIMALATQFILLARRDKLESEDNLLQQKLTVADYNPNSDFKPEHAFMRLVILNCAHVDLWARGESPLVAAVDVALVVP